MKAGIEIDVSGCPNRCRHCWVGSHPDGTIPGEEFVRIAERFKNYQKDGNPFFSELTCKSWYREPDYADNYRELWDLEQQVSTGTVEHFDLASVWRLARDESYAPWLYDIGVRSVQLTLFGTEHNTDYFTGRRGAYQDIMKSIDNLIENGIAPLIQIFPFSSTISDVNFLWYQLQKLELEAKVRDIGQDLRCFAGFCTPMGNAYNLINIFMRQQDIDRLPPALAKKTAVYFGVEKLGDFLKTEAELLPSLLEEDRPFNDNPPVQAFMINDEGEVYPNCGELTSWWSLGNIRKDSIDTIIGNYIDHNVPGLKMLFEMPVSYFAKKYGDAESTRVWTRNDLIHKWLHIEGLTL